MPLQCNMILLFQHSTNTSIWSITNYTGCTFRIKNF